MAETIRYGRIGKQDLQIGTGKFEVILADGRVVMMDEINLTSFPSTALSLVAPDGGTWKLSVDNDGILRTVKQ